MVDSLTSQIEVEDSKDRSNFCLIVKDCEKVPISKKTSEIVYVFFLF